MTEITRREFIKFAGLCAGAAATITAMPGLAYTAADVGGEEAVMAASVISSPAFIAPAIIKTGEAIPVKTLEGTSAKVEKAWLKKSGNAGAPELALDIADASSWKLSSAPEPGLYDLYLNVSSGNKSRIERRPISVKLVSEFKKDFSFGIISDIHFGDSRVQGKLPGFSVAEALKKEIDILNDNKVEFCLCCGDLCFIPPKTKNQVLEYADALIKYANFPIFTVVGNHEGYSSGAGGRISYNLYKFWTSSLGPLYFDASYGDMKLIGINTYDKDAALRNLYGGFGDKVDNGAISAAQLSWLENILKTSREKSSSVITFGHQNPTNNVVDVNGPFRVVPFSETGRKELLALFEKYSPDYYFCGHVHGVHEETYSKTKIVTCPTAGSLPADGQPIGIDIARVKNGKIASIETIVIAKV